MSSCIASSISLNQLSQRNLPFQAIATTEFIILNDRSLANSASAPVARLKMTKGLFEIVITSEESIEFSHAPIFVSLSLFNHKALYLKIIV
jgi:hypothetical protein